MKFFLTPCLLLFTYILWGQSAVQVSDGAKNQASAVFNVSKSYLDNTKRDAARLALRLDANNQDFRAEDVRISKASIAKVQRILESVLNSNLDAAKSVYNCRIHTTTFPAIDKFIIIYDKKAAWAAPLLKNELYTNNADINRIFEKYDLHIVGNVEWEQGYNAMSVASTNQHYNMAALAEEFSGIAGVKEASVQQNGIYTNAEKDIEISRTRAGIFEVTYILRWGSCLTGCKFKHTWTFQVEEASYKAKFLHEKGDALPENMRCNEISKGSVNL